MAKIKATVFIEEELLGELYTVADRMLWSKSAALELAIKKFLEQYGDVQLLPSRPPLPLAEPSPEEVTCQ